MWRRVYRTEMSGPEALGKGIALDRSLPTENLGHDLWQQVGVVHDEMGRQEPARVLSCHMRQLWV